MFSLTPCCDKQTIFPWHPAVSNRLFFPGTLLHQTNHFSPAPYRVKQAIIALSKTIQDVKTYLPQGGNLAIFTAIFS